MTRGEVPRARSGLVPLGLSVLALTTAAGCSSDEYGSVSATPKSSPDVASETPSQKAGAVPRVPRGPDQAKALQESKAK
jgi:hypothetical protein